MPPYVLLGHSRVATAGFYYPAHIDCAANLLYSVSGERTVRLLDIKALLHRVPEKVDQVLALKLLDENIPTTLGCEVQAKQVLLRPGDALFIPVLWSHDVYYNTGGVGLNSFFGSDEMVHKGDPMLCMYLKNPKRLEELQRNGQLKLAIEYSEIPLANQNNV